MGKRSSLGANQVGTECHRHASNTQAWHVEVQKTMGRQEATIGPLILALAKPPEWTEHCWANGTASVPTRLRLNVIDMQATHRHGMLRCREQCEGRKPPSVLSSWLHVVDMQATCKHGFMRCSKQCQGRKPPLVLSSWQPWQSPQSGHSIHGQTEQLWCQPECHGHANNTRAWVLVVLGTMQWQEGTIGSLILAIVKLPERAQHS